MALSGRRAQMLLIGAITLAVLFVSLSVVLNGTINTTTSSGQASAETNPGNLVAVQDALRRDVSFIMHKAIAKEPDDFSAQQTYISENLTSPSGSEPVLEDQYSDYYARNGGVVAFSSTTVVEGVKVQQTDDPFTTSTTTLGVASDTELRKFNLQITSFGTDPFRIIIDQGGDTWTIEVSGGGGTSTISVDDGTSTTTCSGDGAPDIELTNATVDGEPCPALRFFTDLDPSYDVTFENGDQVGGDYSFIAKEDALTDVSVYSGASRSEITYGVLVDLVYRSPQVNYQGDVEIAPGEPT